MLILPAIDLAALSSSQNRVRTEAAKLDLACREIGLVEVVGHGVPADLTRDLFEVTREFFALSVEAKSSVAQPAPDQVRGWSGLGSEGIAYSLDEESPADLKEKMDMGPPADPRARVRAGHPAGPHLAPNVWPRQLPVMAATWTDYYRHMTRVGASLMTMCAVAWGLPRDFFADKFDRSISMLRAIHYPPQVETPLLGQLRAGAHTDYGAFTLICADDRPGGLEVLDVRGTWTPVNLEPTRLIAVVGDLFAEWTDDTWTSTLHRVANPPRAFALESSRLAFAFYDHPNYDTEVEILPPFLSSATSPLGPTFTAGEHLRQKYLRQTTFGRRAGEEHL